MGRGTLSEKVKKLSKSFLGYEMTVRELRLLPYIHYELMNSQKIDPLRINGEEREIFQKWKKAGHIDGGMTRLAVTKEFWDFMCEVLFISYVAQED